MALRTNVESVKTIINTSLTDVNILAYLNQANAMVTAYLSGSDLTDAILAEIEKWLTAHLISITKERTPQSEGVGGANITYTGVFGEGLRSTTYGQMILFLDTSRTLEDMGKQNIVFKAITSFE